MSDSKCKIGQDTSHGLHHRSNIPLVTEEYRLRELMLEPKNTMKWNALALSHMMNGHFKKAEHAIDCSLDLDTSNHWTWRIWGDILHLQSRNKASENAYRMALSLEPTDVHVMFRLAGLCFNRGAYIEGTEVMMRLAMTTPNDQRVWDILTDCLNSSQVRDILSERHKVSEVKKNEYS